MALRNFEYVEPKSVREACRILSDYPEEARIFAGGTSLILLMKQGIVRPTYLVNIKKLPDLRYIRNDGPDVRLGALTTHHDIEVSSQVRESFPMISEVMPEVANVRVRTMGTLGGNLGFAEPLTDLPPILIALDAQVTIEGVSGTRSIELEQLFVNYYETSLAPGELITEVGVRRPVERFGLKYMRFSAGSDKPAIGCAVGLRFHDDGKTCADARVVLGCVASTPLRVREAEAALVGREISDAGAEQVAQIASRACSPLSDLRGSAEYKRAIVQVLARRGLAEAVRRAGAAAPVGGKQEKP